MHKKDVPQGNHLWKKNEEAVEGFIVSSGSFSFVGIFSSLFFFRKFRFPRFPLLALF